MSDITFQFSVNFFAILVLALAIDHSKEHLANYISSDVEDLDLNSTYEAIGVMNTISLTFAAAVNTHSCFIEGSQRHLTAVGLAYLLHLGLVLVFILRKTDRIQRLD